MLPAFLPGHPLQKHTDVQWDIGAALGADHGADESTSPQAGINLFRAVQDRTLILTLKAFIALVVTWCLLAVAAVVAASTQRFEGLYMYLVAAAVLLGLVIVAAIAMAP
jgi:hypothetical protein